MSTAPSTRPGSCAARASAREAPIDTPATTASLVPVASSTATASARYSEIA